MTEPIRIDEVLAELERLHRQGAEGPEGFTCRELAEQAGVASNTAQSWLRDLVYSGRVEFAGKRDGVSIAGVRCKVPVYRQKGATK